MVLYGRVSSHGQRAEGDLDRQMSRLREAAKGRVVVGEYSDVASGLSDRRRGLRRALLACQAESVSVLLVTHEERLARFGTAMLAEVVLPSWGVRLEIASGDEAGDGDLARDMLAIVTSFSGRLYGARSAKARAVARAVKSTVDEGDL
ncbi:hypothetical protein IQ63_17535 [Streptomyces acidiscabies]|uniref:Resolvase/invertase-type recombinase catalytic domain-containing protein n=1 Tax=Streptomyces acidiscabies TaxID=42234 RepID=A0A0L0K834_9ACTN|nr:hypothetical protein IQ63_17535 [Streptomyces acidiscabies]